MGKKFPRKNKISMPTGMRPAAIASTIMALKTGYIADSVYRCMGSRIKK